MQRVLFFAEAVTLAHVARPSVIAAGLDPARFDWSIACAPRYARFLPGPTERHLPLNSIDSNAFLAALARGSPVYDLPTLKRYVEEDLELIDRVRPDVVVGDFRLSLSVSARLARVPYVTITNAYWSPYYARKGFPLPVLPMTRVLPIPLAEAIFRMAQPLAFALHCRPMNQLRATYGMPSLGHDLRRVYTDADVTLYADDEHLFPTIDRPASHHYLGALLWSPPVPVPEWWDRLPNDRPMVYVTFGSSGDSSLLAQVLRALAELDVTLIAATAGSAQIGGLPSNVFVADYLPGIEACTRAGLVICNGGSLTTQQALAAGRTVVGITSNMDQFLNMLALEAAGLGTGIRADCVAGTALRAAVTASVQRMGGASPREVLTQWRGGVPPGWPVLTDGRTAIAWT